jgi:hypothetical protein
VALVLASLKLRLWAVLVLQVYAHVILRSDEPVSVGRVDFFRILPAEYYLVRDSGVLCARTLLVWTLLPRGGIALMFAFAFTHAGF